MDLKKILVLGGVGVTSAAVGILLPTMMSGGSSAETVQVEKDTSHDAPAGHDKPKTEAEPKKDAGGHGGHGKAEGKEDVKPVVKEGPVFLPFGRMVVNL